VLEYRPVLYRAADALDPTGGAREIADSLYADLYGLNERDGERRSLFRYFEGRSSLATWLRAVLAQRFVDRMRSARRFDPLDDDEVERRSFATSAPHDPPTSSSEDQALLRRAIGAAIQELPARDRLRLGCYYQEELTLAQTGRVLGEHEATVSRQLARTRRAIRDSVERQLGSSGLSRQRITACFEAAAEDPGPLDIDDLIGDASPRNAAETRSRAERKKSPADRST
jgi:RNA polymerase sigma-70 factor (ECF subfamily)